MLGTFEGVLRQIRVLETKETETRKKAKAEKLEKVIGFGGETKLSVSPLFIQLKACTEGTFQIFEKSATCHACRVLKPKNFSNSPPLQPGDVVLNSYGGKDLRVKLAYGLGGLDTPGSAANFVTR